MKKYFELSKLAAIVAPEALRDVLDSLKDNGLVEEYAFDYNNNEVEIIIPKNVEIAEVMTGFQTIVESGRKGSIH